MCSTSLALLSGFIALHGFFLEHAGNRQIDSCPALLEACVAGLIVMCLVVLFAVPQVENGKGAMPAWDGRLDEDEIDSVSAYVYDKAANDSW